MAKKPVTVLDMLVEMFQEDPGAELVKGLKNGASVQVYVDGEYYGLERSDGAVMIYKGELRDPDILLEMNRAACEYLVGSDGLDDLVARFRECGAGDRDSCELSYDIRASLVRMWQKGYLDFARKLGIF
jgi:hypothetical protein